MHFYYLNSTLETGYTMKIWERILCVLSLHSTASPGQWLIIIAQIKKGVWSDVILASSAKECVQLVAFAFANI